MHWDKALPFASNRTPSKQSKSPGPNPRPYIPKGTNTYLPNSGVATSSRRKLCAYLHVSTSTGIASGLPYLETLVPEPKKELAESIARSLDGLVLEVSGACHQPTVLTVAGW